jgi:DNA-binding protein YbaB
MHTIKYKNGYIHVNFIGKNEVIRVMVDQYAYAIQVKSVHAAKIMITKHNKKYGG